MSEAKCEDCQNYCAAPEGRHCVPYIEKPPMLDMKNCPAWTKIVLAPQSDNPVSETTGRTGEYLHLRSSDPTVTRSTIQ